MITQSSQKTYNSDFRSPPQGIIDILKSHQIIVAKMQLEEDKFISYKLVNWFKSQCRIISEPKTDGISFLAIGKMPNDMTK